MNVTYTSEKRFCEEDLERLFLSVNWLSGRYPKRLFKALHSSSFVATAWDGDRLVGLIRALDDSEMVAFLHYLLVDPEYQGLGIARELVEIVKERYTDYLYLNLMPEEDKNIEFYERHGFSVVKSGAPMQIKNLGSK